jgi:hypothetical protein
MHRSLPGIMLYIFLAVPCLAQSDSQRENWFHDPFFQISDAVPDCPMPAGPFVTAKERTAEAHHRGERGTSCWLEGKCDRPSSYDYDQDIAGAFKSAIATANPFKDSTLWVTVQGRAVFIEGCAEDRRLAARIEAFTMQLPYVQVAVAKVRTDPSLPPPYPLLNSP